MNGTTEFDFDDPTSTKPRLNGAKIGKMGLVMDIPELQFKKPHLLSCIALGKFKSGNTLGGQISIRGLQRSMVMSN